MLLFNVFILIIVTEPVEHLANYDPLCALCLFLPLPFTESQSQPLCLSEKHPASDTTTKLPKGLVMLFVFIHITER